MMKPDMSPQAVSRRLNELNQLWKLCVTLSKARPVASSSTRENLDRSYAGANADPIQKENETGKQ